MDFKGQGTSLAVQWLRLCASNAGDMGLIPGRGTKIPHATRHGQKKLKKKSVLKNWAETSTITQCGGDRFHNLGPGKLFLKLQQYCWEGNQNPELLQYINLKCPVFNKNIVRHHKKQTNKKPHWSVTYTQGKTVVNRNWLWVDPDIAFSRECLQGRCYKFVQVIKGNYV